MLKTARSYLIVLYKTPECDGRTVDRQTDGQNPSSYYGALYCEQCGRAVKIRSGGTLSAGEFRRVKHVVNDAAARIVSLKGRHSSESKQQKKIKRCKPMLQSFTEYYS